MQGGTSESHTLYHGTSWEIAQIIKREGFRPSSDGCLGPGTYVARAGWHFMSCMPRPRKRSVIDANRCFLGRQGLKVCRLVLKARRQGGCGCAGAHHLHEPEIRQVQR